MRTSDVRTFHTRGACDTRAGCGGHTRSAYEARTGYYRVLTRVNELLEARADALSITDDEPALAHAHREATSRRGAVQHAPDHDELDGQVLLPTRRKARIDGLDLDAEVAVQAHDHERREGLLRYFLRPPLSHDRLRRRVEALPDQAWRASFLTVEENATTLRL
jgi:hypothetical protein